MNIFTSRHTAFSYYADYVVYLAAILTLSLCIRLYTPNQALIETVLSIGGGLLCWSFIEYVMHRFLFHAIQPFQRMHEDHHIHPKSLIATPTIISFTLIIVLVWLPATLIGGLWNGLGFTLGVTIGYFVYGIIHHAMHHWRLKNAWIKKRTRLHAIHHHSPHYNYGVTMSLWDYIFHRKN
ncbi:MAG TPA: sterol desaturase family protein [Halothiobacillus sp.]|nr:sterol desaturase family protein [Halothiobacillus sp.]